MVMDYGMSRLGRITFRHSPRSSFLNPGYEEQVRQFSEETAKEIDVELKRILEKALDNVTEILKSRYDALVAVAKRLIEIESVDSAELKRIIEEHTPGPQVVPGTSELPKRERKSNPDPDELVKRPRLVLRTGTFRSETRREQP